MAWRASIRADQRKRSSQRSARRHRRALSLQHGAHRRILICGLQKAARLALSLRAARKAVDEDEEEGMHEANNAAGSKHITLHGHYQRQKI